MVWTELISLTIADGYAQMSATNTVTRSRPSCTGEGSRFRHARRLTEGSDCVIVSAIPAPESCKPRLRLYDIKERAPVARIVFSMPRYFFDTVGQVRTADGEGVELADHRAARFRAISLVGHSVAEDPSLLDITTEFRVDVRNAHGALLFTVTTFLTEALAARR